MNKYIKIIGPGLLVAATGVGAGDLATSALAGSHIGLTAISAIVIGGVIKYFLNEG
ncbi:MAG TPA: iron transporter, partial [Cytophagales bacterium]|nr:iron transporter [Cytophagales bacterium]